MRKSVSLALIRATLIIAGILVFGLFVIEHFTDRIDTEHTVWILQLAPFVVLSIILFLILVQPKDNVP